MMRIAWITPGFQGREDEPGIPTLTALAQAIAERDDLRVFSVRFPPRADRYWLGAVEVRSFGQESGSSTSRAWRRLASALRWVRVLRALALEHRRSPFTVIHGFWATEAGMLAALAGRLLGVPALVSLAGGELAAVRPAGYGSRLRLLERAQVALALQLAAAVGVPSRDAGSRLLARYPWLRARLRPLPLGYDPALFPPSVVGAQADAYGASIVCMASWTPVKGYDLLLDAVAILVQRGLQPRLVLVGERTDGSEARAAVARRDLEPHVRLLGALPQREVATILAGARVAMITSWHEAECLAVVEALACGVPVVATPVGIARELLGDSRVGTCASRRSPALLAEALAAQLCRSDESELEARMLRQGAVAHLALPEVAARFRAEYVRLTGVHAKKLE